MTVGGAIANVTSGISDYQDAREQGDSAPIAIGKALASFAFGELLGPAALPIYATKAAIEGVTIAGQHTGQTMSQAYNRKGNFGSGYFDMSQAGYTMRQRSLNAIRQNGMNINSTLGNEARTYFRTS